MTIRKNIIISGTVLLISIFMNITTASASVVDISSSVRGSVLDETADGIFDQVSGGFNARAQQTNFLDIFRVRRGIIEFDISSITSPVDNAQFSFYITGLSGPNTAFNIFGYEGNGTLELSDAELGTTLVGTIATDLTGRFDVDVTDFINSSLLSGFQFSGFNLRITSEYTTTRVGYNNAISINTSSNSAVFIPPVLTVSTVPLPASIWLFLSGASLLTLIGRKRKLRENHV